MSFLSGYFNLSAYNFLFITGFEQFNYATSVGFLYVSLIWDFVSFLNMQVHSIHVWKILGLCPAAHWVGSIGVLKPSKLFFCPV